MLIVLSPRAKGSELRTRAADADACCWATAAVALKALSQLACPGPRLPTVRFPRLTGRREGTYVSALLCVSVWPPCGTGTSLPQMGCVGEGEGDGGGGNALDWQAVRDRAYVL